MRSRDRPSHRNPRRCTLDLLGISHLTLAVGAMLAALAVFLLPKGTRAHRRAGWVYVSGMAGLNVTALGIYDLLGRFGPFHWAALGSLLTVIFGMIPVRRRQPRRLWVRYHAAWMVWSAVGLYAAAASEIATRYLDVRFWGAVLAATLAVFALGALLIRRFLPRSLARFLPATAR